MKREPSPANLKSVQDYLEVPVRRPLLVVVPAALVLTLAIVLAYVLPEMYRSSTLILVEDEKVPDTFVTKLATERVGRRLQTVRQEVLSRTRLERVIEEIDPYPSTEASPAPISEQVEDMRGSITIGIKGSDAFTIEYVHTDPVMAMRVASRLATLFIEEAEMEREQQAVEGSEFIDSQLEEIRVRLEEKDAAVRQFKERNLGRLPQQLDTNVATLQRLQLEQQTLAESIRGADARSDQLRQSLRSGTPAVGTVGADPLVALTEARQQLVTLRSRYTEHHPDVKAAVARVNDLEASLRPAEVGEVDGGGDLQATSTQDALEQSLLELELLRQRRASVTRKMTSLQARVESAPRVEQELSGLTRDYSQLHESYLNLLKKQIDARMAEQLERRWKGERFKILDPADVPDEPFFPQRWLFAFAGLFAGVGLGLVSAFAAELFDHSIKSPEQLEDVLGKPLLATIPHIDSR